jgi:phage terminase large subunit-like protein
MSSQPAAERKRWLSSLTPTQARLLRYEWRFYARPDQLPPPGDWRTWLILTGRGWGKTRATCEYVRARVESGTAGRVALIAATAADARDVLVEGESGILAIWPPEGGRVGRPTYEPSKRRLTWPNGAIATTYSAEEPDRLRGPQHDLALGDEIAVWPPETWDMLQFGLRLGPDPRAVAATTPRPVKLVRDLLAAPTTAVTRGATRDNALNLPPAFLDQIAARYHGTRLGRQEIEGELIEDVEGALWQRDQLDRLRRPAPADLRRVVVAIDPAMTSGEDADETGIVVAATALCSCLGKSERHGFVLADLTTRASPDAWARRAIGAFEDWRASLVVAEVNNGGELVKFTLRTLDPHLPYKAVHASRGKRVRAEPIAALYEQGKVHHAGAFAALEDQQCNFVPDDYVGSPDRVDALVWALTELMVTPTGWGAH